MLEFPTLPPHIEPPAPRLSLLDYAHFSERCLAGNPTVTPENCLERRADERDMREPFRLVQSPEVERQTGSR